MNSDPRLTEHVLQAIQGSGLPLESRAQVAEEWCSHLEEQAQAAQESGLSADDAVRTALGRFGDPAVLRRRLRRMQGLRDHRQVVGELRSRWLALAIVAVSPMLLLGLLNWLLDGASAAHAFGVMMAGAVVGPFVLGSLVLVLYPLLLTRARMKARLPCGERPSLVGRFISSSVMLMAALAASELVLASGFVIALAVLNWIFGKSTQMTFDCIRIFRDCLIDFVPNATPIMAIVAGVAALVLAGCEWRTRQFGLEVGDSV